MYDGRADKLCGLVKSMTLHIALHLLHGGRQALSPYLPSTQGQVPDSTFFTPLFYLHVIIASRVNQILEGC